MFFVIPNFAPGRIIMQVIYIYIPNSPFFPEQVFTSSYVHHQTLIFCTTHHLKYKVSPSEPNTYLKVEMSCEHGLVLEASLNSRIAFVCARTLIILIYPVKGYL